ncbi:MAG: [FeFe] hydrogenase H-cluster radical SAM maturase HydE [Candidatus Mcinerneyibacterium aminivorans]|uniref:[FeFe] hydrogenase H-cluster radical SAM maturase HydE n=1 Tax=Candidatus Mcinerneyibacterium aminivorans TaxID=2703815 RepID=A0A5D0MJF8_9BACT|nr:MAG: [FeFe] hydrogenase H-cluster radical SAM maturase HydE [Candidatus Mcinerneyibacterium aminivorans]
MCYAIPGQVVDINKKRLIVEYFGEKRKVLNEFLDISIGDYIYAQGGYAINKIPEKEAVSILTAWRETFFNLQKVDLKISKRDYKDKNIRKDIANILDKAVENKDLSKKELLKLMNIEKKEELEMLYKTANFLRRKYMGNSCCVHGIIEYSNNCVRNCKYCGISTYNSDISRYNIEEKNIVKIANKAVNEHGFMALVLQSGESDEYSIEKLCRIIKKIRKDIAVLIFISMGELSRKELQKLYDAGARGFLLRFETSNEELYSKLHPGYRLEDRINCIQNASDIGYFIVTGGLIGLPGQTRKDVLNSILLARKLKTEMYSFAPFIPTPNTPLNSETSPEEKEVLKTLAISRIVDPENAKILITTAFETINKSARKNGLLAGGNSLMLNVTPDKYKNNYFLYPNRAHNNETIQEQIDETVNLLNYLGRAPTDIGINWNS